MPNHETWEYISCHASSQAVVVLIVWLNRRNVTCATLTWQFSRDENYLHLFTPGLDVGRRGRSPPSVYQQPYCRTPSAIISSSPPANAWLEFIPVTTVSISPPAAAGFRVCLAPAGRFKNGKGKICSDHEMRSPLHRFLCVVIRWMSLEEISVDVLEKSEQPQCSSTLCLPWVCPINISNIGLVVSASCRCYMLLFDNTNFPQAPSILFLRIRASTTARIVRWHRRQLRLKQISSAQNWK